MATCAASAFEFNPALMKGRNSYVTMVFDEAGGFTSAAITPADDSWTAPTYPSTYLCRAPEDTTDRANCRSYGIYVPTTYDGSRPAPLHLSLHGNGGFAEAQIGDVPKNDGTGTTAADNSGLEGRYNQLAEQHGFIAVYPNGIPNGGSTVNGRMWNDCRIGEPASTADDVKFIGALLDDVMSSLNMDRGRVYANGYSNGAVMMFRLYAELGERFTAFATMAGNQPLDNQTECAAPTVKKPLMLVFGDEDAVVPYYGVGVRVSMRSADDTILYWTQHLGADQPTTDDRVAWQLNWTLVPNVSSTDGNPDSRGYTKVFGNGAEGTQGVGPTLVFAKKINQGGHTLSGLTPFTSQVLVATLGPKNLDVQIADEFYSFFSQFEMKAPPAAVLSASAASSAAQGRGLLLGGLALSTLLAFAAFASFRFLLTP
ncbi:MAG: hypothetical protein AABY95_07055 [Pseudomonadota bacterium]